jgi:hypothetical protein
LAGGYRSKGRCDRRLTIRLILLGGDARAHGGCA